MQGEEEERLGYKKNQLPSCTNQEVWCFATVAKLCSEVAQKLDQKWKDLSNGYDNGSSSLHEMFFSSAVQW